MNLDKLKNKSMSVYGIVIIIVLVALVMYVIYKYVPEPMRTGLLWLIGFALSIWLLNALGVLDALKGLRV